jgi:CHAT domain-containing protein
MVGLTRAFMFAGTPTVVSSLWPVADDSTSELMKRFYANMEGGQDKAEAMRQAQLSLVADHPEWASPYFWAPFEVWGLW